MRTLIFAFSVATAAAQAPDGPPLNGIVLPQAFADLYGAKCLDGSPPLVYTLVQDPTKWILFMEGGGWCFGPTANATIESCAHRAGSTLGSTRHLTSGATLALGGMLSPNSTTNPYLYNYSFAFLHYCDGASGSSAAVDAIPVPPSVRAAIDASAPPGNFQATPTQIWMRGRANLVAQVNYLLQFGNMSAPVDVILSGGSAGATAAYYGAEVVKALLPASTTFTIAPDAGFFQDYNASAAGQSYRADFQGADPVWNATASGGLNHGCLAAYAAEPWKCFFQQYAAPYITVPTYIFNAAYDAWQVGNDLGLPCQPCAGAGDCTGHTPCTDPQMVLFQAYRDSQIAAMGDTLAVPGNGAWVPSCFVHEMNVDYCDGQGMPNCIGWSPFLKWGAAPYEIAAGSGGGSLTMAAAFQQWHATVTADYALVAAQRAGFLAARAAVGGAAPAATYGANLVTIDAVQYPGNPSCPFPTPAPAARRT